MENRKLIDGSDAKQVVESMFAKSRAQRAMAQAEHQTMREYIYDKRRTLNAQRSGIGARECARRRRQLARVPGAEVRAGTV